ncbi:DUF6879 family protein [Streptomyces sp. NPDC051567]|uniref:DUF6879 family protein n=1 Tax=Streptomyces sp. NPDC051567 TaxID=3365660 RepID=UPI0037962003
MLKKLSGDPECRNGTCPTLWGTEDARNYVVQGHVVTDPERLAQLDLAERAVTGLPDHDFWLFDDRDVYRMHYTPEGAFTGAEPLPAHRLAEYRGYRDHALAAAVPFAEYQERHH